MRCLGKELAVVLILTMVISSPTLLTSKSVNAQKGVTQPVVPAFGVTLRTVPHGVPPTYGVDSSTGKAVIIKAGYMEQYVWVEVGIAGQPFWQYNNSAGQLIQLYYDVRWRSNLDASWQTFPSEIDYYRDAMDPWDTQAIGVLITLGFKGIGSGGGAEGYLSMLDPAAKQIDFQVEALIGYYNSNNVFVGKSSGWSNTYTLEVSIPSDAALTSPASSPIPVTSPTATATVPELSLLMIVPLLLSVFSAAVIVRHREAKLG